MKPTSPDSAVDSSASVSGRARVDRRARAVMGRVRPGDIVVVDESDLDRETAQALVDAEVAAVANGARFFSGRYPSLGAGVLAEAGVPMLEGVGSEVVAQLPEGSRVRLAGDRLIAGKRAWTGVRVEHDDVHAQMAAARSGLAAQLETFTASTSEFLRREQDLLLHGLAVPALRTRITGRPVVVVSRGYDHREDLARLKRFIREQHPVLIGVDGGAETLVEARLRPDVVVVGETGLGRRGTAGGNDAGIVADRTLRRARDVVLHTDPSGSSAGAARLERLGVRHQVMATSGTPEDIALIIADLADPSVIVTAGSHATLEEFLDRQRAGLASIFLTRLKVGARLVEAQAVPELYAGRVRPWQLLLVILAGLVALVAAVATTPVGGEAVRDLLDPVLDWAAPMLDSLPEGLTP